MSCIAREATGSVACNLLHVSTLACEFLQSLNSLGFSSTVTCDRRLAYALRKLNPIIAPQRSQRHIRFQLPGPLPAEGRRQAGSVWPKCSGLRHSHSPAIPLNMGISLRALRFLRFNCRDWVKSIFHDPGPDPVGLAPSLGLRYVRAIRGARGLRIVREAGRSRPHKPRKRI